MRDVVLVGKKVNHSHVQSIHQHVHGGDTAGNEVCSSGAQQGEAIVDVDVSRRLIPVDFG